MTPSGLPRPVRRALASLEVGWDILRDASANYYNNGSFNQAAAIALYAFLSIIPLFILSVLAAGRFLGANVDIQDRLVELIRTIHPYFDRQLLAQLGTIEAKTQVLGWIGFTSLIWFSSLIFGAIETALNAIFRAESHRNFLVSKLLAFAMIPLGWVVGLTSVLLTYAASLLENVHGNFAGFDYLTRFLLQYVVPFVVSVLFVTIVFTLIPARRIRFGTALAGSVLFTALVEVVKHIFTWYVTHHTKFGAIFGSLVTVVVLVIWVYYMALIFFYCAEIMSSYERRDLLLIEHMLLRRQSRTGHQRLFRKFGRLFVQNIVICQEGDRSRDLYFILSGTVRLEMRSGLGIKLIARMGPGDHFGEMAALTGEPRTATVVAETDCEIAVIDGQVFHRLLRESDDLALHMLREFSYRIRRTDGLLDHISDAVNRAEVVLRLLRSWPLPPDRDHWLWLLHGTGLDPRVLQEILRVLEEAGVLSWTDGRVSAFDPEKAWGQLHALSVGLPGRLGVPK